MVESTQSHKSIILFAVEEMTERRCFWWKERASSDLATPESSLVQGESFLEAFGIFFLLLEVKEEEEEVFLFFILQSAHSFEMAHSSLWWPQK